MVSSTNGHLTIREILRGCTPGKLQSVGNMQVIPLILDQNLHDDRFVAPTAGKLDTDQGYGKMSFENPTDKTMLIPAHAGWVIKKEGQDHAMATAGLVKGKKSKTYKNAMCIQASRGGTLKATEDNRMLILPQALREDAYNLRKNPEFGKLWGHISKFSVSMGCENEGHLEYFLNKYSKELDEFVAQFEIVPNQAGAIILVDGKTAGVERAPSPGYWRTIWSAIIRECYGSLSMHAAREAGEIKIPKTRVSLSSRDINTLDDISRAIKSANEKQANEVKQVLDRLIDEPFASENEEELLDLKVLSLKHGQLTGQAIMDGEKVCYASMVTTADWAKNQPWREANTFTM